MPLSVALGVLVVFVLSVSTDATRLIQVLSRFDWAVLPVVVALTLPFRKPLSLPSRLRARKGEGGEGRGERLAWRNAQ